MHLRILMLLTVALAACDMQAQQTIFDEERTIYSRELSGGIMLHGDGWGLHFIHSTYTTARNRRMLHFEIVGMKHPKEVKSFNPYYEDSRGYFYGKVNSFMIVRPSIGKKHQITDKIRRSGVELNYVWSVGPSLGFTKPIYLEIGYQDSGESGIPYDYVVTERYDPNVHYVDDIFGRASWFKGLGELRLNPGAFGRIGLNFEYSGENTGIKALEVGATVDLYAEKVPIMAEMEDVRNKQLFLEFYLAVQLGKKYVR